MGIKNILVLAPLMGGIMSIEPCAQGMVDLNGMTRTQVNQLFPGDFNLKPLGGMSLQVGLAALTVGCVGKQSQAGEDAAKTTGLGQSMGEAWADDRISLGPTWGANALTLPDSTNISNDDPFADAKMTAEDGNHVCLEERHVGPDGRWEGGNNLVPPVGAAGRVVISEIELASTLHHEGQHRFQESTVGKNATPTDKFEALDQHAQIKEDQKRFVASAVTKAKENNLTAGERRALCNYGAARDKMGNCIAQKLGGAASATEMIF